MLWSIAFLTAGLLAVATVVVVARRLPAEAVGDDDAFVADGQVVPARASKQPILGVVVAAIAVVIVVFARPIITAAANGWLLLVDNVYVIPAESSLFTFVPTVMNPGSGDWWIYGEDGRNYYYFTGDAGLPAIAFPKERAATCPNFDPHVAETWCRPTAPTE